MAMKSSGPRAFRPVVMTVVAVVIAACFVAIIISTWSCGRGGRSSAEPLRTWSTWSELGGAARDVVDVAARSVRWSEGMYLAPSHGEAKALGHVQPRSGVVGDLPCLREGYGVALWRFSRLYVVFIFGVGEAHRVLPGCRCTLCMNTYITRTPIVGPLACTTSSCMAAWRDLHRACNGKPSCKSGVVAPCGCRLNAPLFLDTPQSKPC